MVVSHTPDFFDVIRIIDDAKMEEIRGKLGHILGVSEEDGVIYGYGAWIYDFQRVYSVDSDEFELLGYKDELAEADYGKHGSLSVSPDGIVK
jgi:hypothetical protein